MLSRGIQASAGNMHEDERASGGTGTMVNGNERYSTTARPLNSNGASRTIRRAAGMLLVIASAMLGANTAHAQNEAEKPVYLDVSQPIDVRVDDLMRRMTLKEKIGQLNLPCAYVDDLGKTIPEKTESARKFAAGTYTTEIGPGSGFFTLTDTLGQKDLA